MARTAVAVPAPPSSSQRILTTALDLFAVRGYDATSVREICEAAAITKPTLYHFFGSKDGVLRALVITGFVFSDTLDGIMARRIGRSGKWGAYLDSTLDRVGDAAIFGGLVLWFAGDGDEAYMAALALACLILGSVVSYAKARAEGLGMTANVGIAERADRLVVVLAATGLVGWFLPEVVLAVVLGLLALASLVTVVQRMLEVRRQALDLV